MTRSVSSSSSSEVQSRVWLHAGLLGEVAAQCEGSNTYVAHRGFISQGFSNDLGCCCAAAKAQNVLHVGELECQHHHPRCVCVCMWVLLQADFAEQLFSWQDGLFGNTDGRLRLEGCPNPQPAFLWPGPM